MGGHQSHRWTNSKNNNNSETQEEEGELKVCFYSSGKDLHKLSSKRLKKNFADICRHFCVSEFIYITSLPSLMIGLL